MCSDFPPSSIYFLFCFCFLRLSSSSTFLFVLQKYTFKRLTCVGFALDEVRVARFIVVSCWVFNKNVKLIQSRLRDADSSDFNPTRRTAARRRLAFALYRPASSLADSRRPYCPRPSPIFLLSSSSAINNDKSNYFLDFNNFSFSISRSITIYFNFSVRLSEKTYIFQSS